MAHGLVLNGTKWYMVLNGNIALISKLINQILAIYNDVHMPHLYIVYNIQYIHTYTLYSNILFSILYTHIYCTYIKNVYVIMQSYLGHLFMYECTF